MLTLLILTAFAADVAEAGPCVATRRAVVAGAHLTAGDLQTVPCRDGVSVAEIAYSAETRSAVARQMLPAGTYLGRLYADSAVILPKGSRVVLRAVAGPAVIEREVVTLQPARSGGRRYHQLHLSVVFNGLDNGHRNYTLRAPTIAGFEGVERTP